MRTRIAVAGAVVALVILLLLVARPLLGPGSAPAGQPPLTRLSPASAGDFTAAFDARTAVPRLVLLLSPT